MNPKIYINPEGVACYIADCPEEPHCLINFVTNLEYPRQHREYLEAIAAAKESAVPFADQRLAIDIQWESGNEFTLKKDTIHPFPSGYKVEILHGQPCLRCNRDCYNHQMGDCKNQVAVLSLIEQESQEELTALDLKMFIERELGGYRTVHMGRSYRVINRQFVYESDIMSLAEDLLKNFTITRKSDNK